MLKYIERFYYNSILPKTADEKENHCKSEYFFKDRIKLTYERALSELSTSFFRMDENPDLVEQLLGNKHFDPLSRKLIEVALDKKEGHIYVHVNNYFENSNVIGDLYKSHMENDQIIWELFCNVKLTSFFAGGNFYESIDQDLIGPLRFHACNEERFNSGNFVNKTFSIFDSATQEHKHFYPIDKFKSLHKENSLINGDKDYEIRGSPFYTMINNEHIKERILSQMNPTKSARKSEYQF